MAPHSLLVVYPNMREPCDVFHVLDSYRRIEVGYFNSTDGNQTLANLTMPPPSFPPPAVPAPLAGLDDFTIKMIAASVAGVIGSCCCCCVIQSFKDNPSAVFLAGGLAAQASGSATV